MTEAVIVSTARTPIGKAYKGALNNTEGATLLGHAISVGTVACQDRRRRGRGRRDGLRHAAGHDRHQHCAQGAAARRSAGDHGGDDDRSPVRIRLQAIALAARSVIFDGVEVAIGGGGEFISLVQNNQMNMFHAVDPELLAMKGDAYMAMLDTAEIVAKRYDISRERQDEYSLESQRRTASAQQGWPLQRRTRADQDNDGGHRQGDRRGIFQEVTLSADEGPRPDTTAEGLAAVKPAKGPGFTITGGNASQLSDGASAAVIMSDKLAAQKGLKPLGIFRGFVAAGCEPDEMGIGPVFAVPRLLKRHGLKIDDIDLWELNEAFAVQVIYCRDKLGIDPDKLNVNGGSIAVGHPYGMTGARLTGTP